MVGLREFLLEVEENNADEFVRIEHEVDPKYEITGVVANYEKERRAPVILFEKIKGSPYRTVVNVCASRRRLAQSIGTTRDGLLAKYLTALDNLVKPKTVADAPVHEVREDNIDLFRFPRAIFHEGELGPYITAGIVVAKHPETGIRNASYNRLMVKEKDRMSINMTVGKHLWECWKAAGDSGKPLEAAVVIGNHPAWSLGVLYPGAFGVDEYDIVGGLLGRPLEVVKCKTIDIDVPAEAEIILECEILQQETELEGPFCEFAGYVVKETPKPVVRVKAITQRRNALYQLICGGAHYEHLLMGAIPMEANIFRAVKAAVPSVESVHVPTGFTCIISIKKRAEGQARNAILAALAADLYMKHVIVVDEDVDVTDLRQVLWAMGTRMQGDRDIFVIPEVRGSDLDPSAPKDGIVAKVGFDATAKPTLDRYPPTGRIPQEVLEKTKKFILSL